MKKEGLLGETLKHASRTALRACLCVDDEVVAEGRRARRIGYVARCGDGLYVGRDSSDAVSSLYRAPGTFKGGTIAQVEVNVGDDQYLDLDLGLGATAALSCE